MIIMASQKKPNQKTLKTVITYTISIKGRKYYVVPAFKKCIFDSIIDFCKCQLKIDPVTIFENCATVICFLI